ncbi:NUDIX hydrolase [Streptomyces noursei]|uniref:NUDIX hydrolase n=1 Tax=Streptomyces noursei TaxID=1971 RepID=UPI0027E4E5E5|nr:NUDIX hydrolase [Streptomyces noursei]
MTSPLSRPRTSPATTAAGGTRDGTHGSGPVHRPGRPPDRPSPSSATPPDTPSCSASATGTTSPWCLPGGCTIGGESALAALRRKVLEETGLHATPGLLLVEHRMPATTKVRREAT